MDVRNVADCYGNSFIAHPGDYELQFTGRTGTETDLSAYSSLLDIELNNTFWTSFSAPHDGLFLFSGVTEGGEMDVIVFSKEQISEEEKANRYSSICDNINTGTAIIERIIKVDGSRPFGLGKEPNEQFLYGLKMTSQMEVYLMLNSSLNQRIKTQLKVDFEVDLADVDKLKHVTDLRRGRQNSELRLKLRCKRTGLPVKGKMIVANSKNLNGLYSGSDFYFFILNRETLSLSIDAVGFFFQDKEVIVEETKDREITLWLEPAVFGKKIELKGIQFREGSSEIMRGSEQELVRLKDFLLLNSSIYIEIAGHVYEPGEGSVAGKIMSIARARSVMRYLVNSGVNKKRLKIKGYGNEFMIYPEPKFSWQEQANRRVEIIIIKDE